MLRPTYDVGPVRKFVFLFSKTFQPIASQAPEPGDNRPAKGGQNKYDQITEMEPNRAEVEVLH